MAVDAPFTFTSTCSVLLLLSLSSLLLSCSAQNSTCSSQTLFGNRNFSHCVDLPHLNATFHWTYQSPNLTLAFKAMPARPAGWVAWGINPNTLKMPGTQALFAHSASGTAVPTTFNITGYQSLIEGRLLYGVSNLTAEMEGDGMITIFATVMLPNGTSSINQIWQVGPGMNGRLPMVHAVAPENRNSTGVLDLVSGMMHGGGEVMPPTGVPSLPPTGVPSPTRTTPTPGGNSGNKIGSKIGSVVLSLFFLFCASI